MNENTGTLITIITEAPLEHTITRDIERLGAHGFTITDARGKGKRGLRDAGWDASSNIRIEVLCSSDIAEKIARRMKQRYYMNYAMVVYRQEVSVSRPEEF